MGASDYVTTYMLVTRFCRLLEVKLSLIFSSVIISIFRELYGVFQTIITDNLANMRMDADKWRFSRSESRSKPSFLIVLVFNIIQFWDKGISGNLFNVLHMEGIVKNHKSYP